MCLIMYILLQFAVLIIFNACLLFTLLFVSLNVDHDITNASLYLCFSIYIYKPVCMCLNIDIFTIYFYYISIIFP